MSKSRKSSSKKRVLTKVGKLTHEQRCLKAALRRTKRTLRFEACTSLRLVLCAAILLMIAFNVFSQGAFYDRKEVSMRAEQVRDPKKLIFLVIDSLRDDPDTLFTQLQAEQPDNTYIASLTTELPSYSPVSVHSFFTSVPPSIHDFWAGVLQRPQNLDPNHLLYSYNQGPRRGKVLVAGDSVFVSRFQPYANYTFAKPSYIFYENDDFDSEIKQNLLLAMQTKNFSVFIGQFSGLDYAAHYDPDEAYSAKWGNLEAMVK